MYALGRPSNLRDLVVLGLLSEQPRYGYEIKMIIDHVMSHVIDISSGSLYYGIKKLQQNGHIEESTIEKVGRRPERSVYDITRSGRRYLQRELPNVIFPLATPVLPINLALYFFDKMTPKERMRRIKMRKEQLRCFRQHVLDLRKQYKDVATEWHMLINVHMEMFVKMEAEFLNHVIEYAGKVEDYDLTEDDLDEVMEEVDNFKKQLDYDTYHQSGAKESA